MSIILSLLLIVGSLILFVTVLKINPYLSFLLVSILAGIILGLPLGSIPKSMGKGIGDMLGSIIVVISLGAMLGKLVAESGAAQVISNSMIQLFGTRFIQWGLMCTGFIIGIPLFYNVGFVLCIPIIFALVYQFKLNAVYIGLPMLAALSVAHGFLPPHPSPVALVGIFHASMAKTLFYGFILAVPIIILAGPIFSQTLKNIKPLSTSYEFKDFREVKSHLPTKGISFFSALLPVFLLGVSSLLGIWLPKNGIWNQVLQFISDPGILMLLALVIASFTLGDIKAKGIKNLMKIYEASIKDIALILLIIGSSGALKQILIDSGISQEIALIFIHSPLHPLILAWLISASIRVCLGSATIAGLTTAGIIQPMMAHFQLDPSLMVLSIGAGSLMFSHVNDPGFWMFKEYFHISLKDTFRSWTMMETLVSILGIVGVMLLNYLN